MGDHPAAAEPVKQRPKIAEWLIRVLVHDETILGDLQESLATRSSYWKEAMAMIPYAIRKHHDVLLAIVLGIAAGVGLVVAHAVSHRGAYLLFIYAGLMLAVAIGLGFGVVGRYRRHFAISLAAFCIASAIQYTDLMFDPHIVALPLWGHAWRIAFMIAIGALFAAITSLFSSRDASAYLLFPFIPVALDLWFFVTRSMPPRVLRFVLPFGLAINWRRDGWGWAFSAADVLTWTAIGLVALWAVSAKRRSVASA